MEWMGTWWQTRPMSNGSTAGDEAASHQSAPSVGAPSVAPDGTEASYYSSSEAQGPAAVDAWM